MRGRHDRLDRVQRRLPDRTDWPTAEELDAEVARLAVLLEFHPMPDLGDPDREVSWLAQLLESHDTGRCPTGHCPDPEEGDHDG